MNVVNSGGVALGVAKQATEPEQPRLTRQQRRALERQQQKGTPDRSQGMTLNIVQVPSKGVFRVVERGTQNFMRGPNGTIIDFKTAESAHEALVRLKALNEKNIIASQEQLAKMRQVVQAQVAHINKEGNTTGLEGYGEPSTPD